MPNEKLPVSDRAREAREYYARELEKGGFSDHAANVRLGFLLMRDMAPLRAIEAALSQAPAGGVVDTYAAFQQRRGRLPDLIEEAIEIYDGFMKDDDYDTQRCLDRVIEKLRSARDWYDAPIPAPAQVERVAELVEPWANFNGDLPDYDHPLRCVFESGVQYTVELLAKTLGVDDYQICDGTEEFDGDLGGTLFNIVLATMPEDADGDRMWPEQVRAALASLGRSAGGGEDHVDGPHPTHKLRSSDASTFDVICEYCSRTDQSPGGWGKLTEPCPAPPAADGED